MAKSGWSAPGSNEPMIKGTLKKMTYETLETRPSTGGLTITLNRPARENAINAQMLRDLNAVLDAAEREPDCRLLILEGRDGVFCTGMDFEEATGEAGQRPSPDSVSRAYMNTLKRFSLTSRLIVSKVDGRVMAGGVGFVAASDLVVATPRSRFSLSEALWGLLPACVTPFLIRRIGFQKAYRMTLTTLPVSAQEALASGLIDELGEDPDARIRGWWLRLARLESGTVENIKAYFRKMWLVTEEMEEVAVQEIAKLMTMPKIRTNIRNFVEHNRFPWDKD